jgi:hypothetical protein
MKELPPSCYQLWYWFIELNSKRQSGMGINAISWSDTAAYFDLIGVKPTQEELSIIGKLDNIAMNQYSKQQEQKSKEQNTNKKK